MLNKENKMQHIMRIIDNTGDTKLMWDAAQADEVEAARDTFNKLKKKKYNAYAVQKNGAKGEIITEFDPDAEKIIMAPPMVGG